MQHSLAAHPGGSHCCCNLRSRHNHLRAPQSRHPMGKKHQQRQLATGSTDAAAADWSVEQAGQARWARFHHPTSQVYSVCLFVCLFVCDNLAQGQQKYHVNGHDMCCRAQGGSHRPDVSVVLVHPQVCGIGPRLVCSLLPPAPKQCSL